MITHELICENKNQGFPKNPEIQSCITRIQKVTFA